MPAVQLSDGANVADSPPSPNSTPAGPDIPDPVTIEELPSESETKTDNDEPKDEWVDILGSGQLKMKVIKKGQPDTRPQPPDICEIKLKGTLEDGTVVEEYDSFQMQLGCHEVVQGLELAVPMMDLEEEAVIVISPRFAYGSIGNPPHVPPNVVITYNVTLLKAEPEPELEEIPFDKRKIIANIKRERGNWWYARQDATKAIQCYRKALDILDEAVPYSDKQEKDIQYSDAEMKEVVAQKLRIFNNLAAAQLMIGAYDSALSSVNRVIQHEPENVKALFRKAKILTAKGEISGAVEALRQAYVLQPENNAIKMELSRCVKVQQMEKQHEKNLYKKMLGQNKKNGKSSEVSKKKFGSWTKVLGTAATATVMAAIAFAVGYRFKNYSFL